MNAEYEPYCPLSMMTLGTIAFAKSISKILKTMSSFAFLISAHLISGE
jgi:hypothetical protein